MPPAFRNHRAPTACGTPAVAAASSLDKPVAIAAQNLSRCSRPAAGGRPGENNGARPDRSDLRFRPFIANSSLKLLRRPLESALDASVAMINEPGAPNGPALVQGLLEGIEHEAGVSRARHPPAHDAPRIGVDHEADVYEARQVAT